MTDSTSITDLPLDPSGGGVISDKNKDVNVTSPMSLDQTTISQIVSGLQQASITGVTQLPSRDMSMSDSNITQDPYVQPNYIPPQQLNKNYIDPNEEETEDMIRKYNLKENKANSLDNLYNEIQTPLLLGVLYFLFQLPFLRKYLFKYFPFLFSKDGNQNINGFIFSSIMFGMFFYILDKLTNQFNQF
jgi:hypothetical protein